MANIAQIDPNFRAAALPYDDIVWYDALDERFSLHGLCAPRETGRYARLPLSFADDARLNEGARYLMFNTAGGRIRFATDSPYVALAVALPNRDFMSHMPLTGSSGADIYFAPKGCSGESFRGIFFPAIEDGTPKTTYIGCVQNPCPKGAEVTITLPLYSGVDRIYIGLSPASVIEPPRAFSIDRPILFYGSSITQGGCASRPGNNYMNHVCRWLDADFINLGFSGSARGELCIADYIASLGLSAFVMDYDFNAPNSVHLARTHYAFYRRIRDAQPELPILLISAPYSYPTGYQSSAFGFGTRHDVILQTYMRAREEGDRHILFLDGASLFADRDIDACTVDGCHPNDLGFYRFAQAVHPALRRVMEV